MEDKTLNILIVDNSITAAEKTRTLLQKEEPRFRFDLACEGEEGLRKAKRRAYDLIVSEYHLTPAMNGLQLLDALRASGIEVPFIFYSSERSLERAVDCLRKGAEDYLFKGEENIRELASSIAKAAEEFRSQKDNQKLLQKTQEEKNYLENIIVNSIDGVVVADQEGKVTLWNRGAEQLFGYTAEEVMGKHVDQFIVPPKFRRTEEKLLRLVEKKGGSFLEKEVKRVRKSGEVIYTTASYNLVRDTNGKIIGLAAIEKDITEQKRLDSELKKAKERYRLQYQKEQRRSTYLNIITQVSRKITAILDLQKLLQKVVNLIPAIGYYQVSIWTSEPEKKRVLFKTGGGEPMRISRGYSQRFKEGIIGWVAYTGKPILANDVSKEPRYVGRLYPETKSEISVPIRFGTRILGVLDIQSTELNAFTREDLSTLQILAAQIAIAMENARLYEEARSKGDYLESLVRNVTDAIVSVDSQGRVVEWNKGAEKIFGYTREEILGKEIDAVIVPTGKQQEAVSITRRAMASREIIDFETIRRRKDGTLINVLLSASPIIKGKKFLGAVAIYKDITERKRAEEELRESEEKYKTLTSNINVGAYRNSVGAKGKFIEANPAIVKMFGYKSREEFLTLNVADLYQNPADRKKFNEKMLKFGYVRDEELQLKKKDGTLFIGSVSTVAAKDEKGKVMYYDGIIEDITERKRAEEAMRIKDSAIASSISAIAITDLEGNLTYVNNSFLKLWGYDSAEQVLGKPAVKFWQLEERASEVLKASPKKGSWVGELVAMRKDGSLFDVHLLASRVTDEAGKPICMMASFIDITERKRIEKEIKRKSQELESFVYTVSHDLKSPLISIKGFSELLKASSRDRLGEKGLHQLERIASNIDEMNRLIGDLLKLSRVGKAVEQPRNVDTLSMAKEIVEELNLRFKIDPPKVRYYKLPIIYTDKLHFRQILQNLLSNAYKFRDENKKLKIAVGCTELHNTYQFYVKDNGIGIEEQHLEGIFHIFRRIEEKKVEGTGAGLAIVKKIVETNGGKIWAKSAKGEGSTFYFTFPKRGKPTSTSV
ncbi:hypothetical protein CEE39_04340 [bacterium (candidate division B38) B3_B38]|nr:MAG: hypothetical protein CEE39_04340 [bacterium (candidate division B38) B3_B38]